MARMTQRWTAWGLGGACALALAGCDLFDGVADAVEGATTSTVAVGLVVRAEPPKEAGDLLEDAELTEGLSATVFLADARSATDLENSPIQGVGITLSGCGTSLALEEAATGTYQLNSPSALDGCADTTHAVAGSDGLPKPLAIDVTVPAVPDLPVPAEWTAGEPMTIDLTGTGYDAAILAVVDASSGSVTWTNRPEGVAETYRFLTSADALGAVEIPGTAFRDQSVHALVVTGLVRSRNAEAEGVNTVLSVVVGGRARPWAVSTLAFDTDL